MDKMSTHQTTNTIENPIQRRYPVHRSSLKLAGFSLAVTHSPGPWLIDTGLPISHGQCGFQFHPSDKPPCWVNLPSEGADQKAVGVGHDTGAQCYGALGADILCETRTTLDLSEGSLEIGSDVRLDGPSFDLSFTNDGCPVIWLDLISQEYLPFLLSTGTRYSYLQNDSIKWNRGKPRVLRDYKWELGTFETTVRTLESHTGETPRLTTRSLLHNRKVSELCNRLRVYGILGWEFFDGHIVQIDRIGREFVVSRKRGKGIAKPY